MPHSNPHPSRGGRRARSSRRRANHAASLTDSPIAGSIPDHPLIPRGAAEWIETDAALEELISHIREAGVAAYDTEFIGESSYWPRLCLVQLATPTRVAVVDAMAEVNLEPVWRLVADDRVKKVLHAGQQDLEPVVRHLGVAPANVFDTQVASGFCALPYPLSLRRLLEATVGVRLPKALTFTSWDERPMSAGHLRYAADDVRYLHAVHADLTERLRRLGHEPYAEAACRELCGAEGYRFDAVEAALRVRGAKGLPADLFSVMVALAALRDEGAKESDVPPRSFLRDEVLIGLARRPPKDRSQLEGWRDLPRPVVERYGQRIIAAVAEARKKPMQPPGVDPDAVEESAEAAFRADGFWAAAQAACLGRGVDPSVVLSRSGAVAFLRELEAKGLEQAIGSLGGWRGELLRPMLRQWLAGEKTLELRWTGEGLRAE